MTDRDDRYRKRLDELMRNAPRRLRGAKRRARSEARSKGQSETAFMIQRLELEIRSLMVKLGAMRARDDLEERVNLKAELVRLREVKRYFVEQMRSSRRPRRKPPEAGLAVPVEPPKGPKPKLGGAEAPLDFDQA